MAEIRMMAEDEAQEVRALGKRTFEWFESLFISRPKDCFVAVEDARITGAVLYKYLTVNKRKIGYVDYIFVDKSAHGKGIGTQLVDRCLKQMDEDGCDGYSAIVKDDNVGSWKMFVNKGMPRFGLGQMIRHCGLSGMLALTFKTPMMIASGMDFYMKLKDKPDIDTREKSLQQIIKYPVLSLLLLLPFLIRNAGSVLSLSGAIALLLLIRLISGYSGTLFSKEKWYFRVCDGGFFIPLISSILGGIYFISGNWYPREYRKTAGFRRSLGITSLTQWISLVAVKLLSLTEMRSILFVDTMADLAGIFLIISIIPFYPLASFGGERIFRWNRILYFLCLLITAASIIFL